MSAKMMKVEVCGLHGFHEPWFVKYRTMMENQANNQTTKVHSMQICIGKLRYKHWEWR